MENAGPGKRQMALSEILVLTGLCLTGMLVFSAAALFLVSFLTGTAPDKLGSVIDPASAGENGRIALLLMQGIISTGSFVLAPSLLRYLHKEQNPSPLLLRPNAALFALIGGLGLLMMPVNAWLSAWNQEIRLPSWLHGFQSWAMSKEAEMEQLTNYLVQFSGWQEGLLGFLVIAVVAGVTEEFFFRQKLQPALIRLTGNPHAGIWLTAFIFSAIHIQFYGLFPRMALGALFGYYYFWTGNIRLSMLAHAFNNGLTLLGLILYEQKISPLNVEDPAQIPWYFGAIAAGLVWSLARRMKEEAGKIHRHQTAKERS